MGLDLRRERFDDWLREFGPGKDRDDYLTRLTRHVGHRIDAEARVIEDDEFPKVGSYATYGVFFDCLRYATAGDFGDELTDDEDIEREALKEFRKVLSPASLGVPYASHFLETGPSDTLLIPLLFESPFAEDDRYVASLPGAVIALEAFALGLGFGLKQDAESEFDGGRWLPASTARNVARILYGFFTEKRDACVAFV